MSGMFGGKQRRRAREQAEKQAGEARKSMQRSNEEAGRETQRAERTGTASRRGRDLLIGTLSAVGNQTLGGS